MAYRLCSRVWSLQSSWRKLISILSCSYRLLCGLSSLRCPGDAEISLMYTVTASVARKQQAKSKERREEALYGNPEIR